MPDRLPPSRGYDQSTRQLSRAMLNNPLRDFLADYAKRDRIELFDDFLGDTINLDNYVVTAAGTGVAFNLTTATVGGAIVASSGTVSGNICSILTPAIWSGDNNCAIEIRAQISTAANIVIEGGFVDSGGTGSTLQVTDVDVPTLVGTNAALFTIDTSQTHSTFAFASIGNFTDQTVATTLLTTSNSHITGPTANTYFTAKIQLIANETGKARAYLWLNGRLVAKHDAAAGAVNGQTSLAGWFAFGTRTGAARTAKVDYIRITQDRVALGAASE